MPAKKRGLGKGLDALLGSSSSSASKPRPDSAPDGELRQLPVEQIQPGRYQPRTGMDPERLAELADSIRAQGVVQPVVVRPIGGGKFELIAGERRWRASQMAELRSIPAVVRHVEDQATVAMALIENIQRENLNPLEESSALLRLIEEFDLTHAEAAQAVGRSRAAVSNLLRLQELEVSVKTLVDERKLEMGHARALLALSGHAQIEAARTVVKRGLSVRETEAFVRRAQDAQEGGTKKKPTPKPDPDVQRLEADLTERLCARVQVKQRGRSKGQLVIDYNSLEELDGIIERIR